MEAYNIKSNEWFHVAPMNTRRSSVGVGVVGGAGNPLVVKSVSSSNPDPSFLNGQANDCFKRETYSGYYEMLVVLFCLPSGLSLSSPFLFFSSLCITYVKLLTDLSVIIWEASQME